MKRKKLLKGARPGRASLHNLVLVAYWHDQPQHIYDRMYTNNAVAHTTAEAITRASDVYTYTVMTYGDSLTLDFARN